MLKRFISSVAVMAVLMTTMIAPVQAATVSLEISPENGIFNPALGESVEIECSVDEDGFRTMQITSEATNSVVKTFAEFDGNDFFRSNDNCFVTWDGTDNAGNVLPDAEYTMTFIHTTPTGLQTVTTANFQILTNNAGNGAIESVTLDPSRTWDPSREDLEIEVDLVQDQRVLYAEIYREVAINNRKVIESVELFDEDYVDNGEYTYSFDGTDDDGDYLEQGEWTVRVVADGYEVKRTIEVKYDEPEFIEAFVTREAFDPTIGEKTYLVVKTSVTSDVTVELDKGNRTEVVLADEMEVRKNRYYAFEWDGTDYEGDYAVTGDYKFRVEATNPTDDDIFDTTVVEVEVIDFDFDEDEANISEHMMTPVLSGTDSAELDMCIDENAEVTVTIHEGERTGSKEEVELLEDYALEAGCHTVEWNGLDKNYKRLSNGMYSYKIVSENEDGRRQTVTGKFGVNYTGSEVVDMTGETTKKTNNDDAENRGVVVTSNNNDDDSDIVDPMPPMTTADCSMYVDTKFVDAELCAAIANVTEWGVFQGYEDGSFGVYNAIDRAETLKVLAMAHRDGMMIPTLNGDNFGFTDLVGKEFSWPMPYVAAGVQNGYFKGYNKNGVSEARLSQTISRAELLKLVIETTNRFNGKSFFYSGSGTVYADVDATDWFAKYADVAYDNILFNERQSGFTVFLDPKAAVTRGEVALVLHRMYEAGLYTPPTSAAAGR